NDDRSCALLAAEKNRRARAGEACGNDGENAGDAGRGGDEACEERHRGLPEPVAGDAQRHHRAMAAGDARSTTLVRLSVVAMPSAKPRNVIAAYITAKWIGKAKQAKPTPAAAMVMSVNFCRSTRRSMRVYDRRENSDATERMVSRAPMLRTSMFCSVPSSGR